VTEEKAHELSHYPQRHISDQYSETNVMYFIFNLLRINDLYMFAALLAHPHEALYKGNLRARYVSWLHQDGSGTPTLVQPTNITRKKKPTAVCVAPPYDEQVMLLNTINKKCIRLVSLLKYYDERSTKQKKTTQIVSPVSKPLHNRLLFFMGGSP
jgi:hypothetical protein